MKSQEGNETHPEILFVGFLQLPLKPSVFNLHRHVLLFKGLQLLLDLRLFPHERLTGRKQLQREGKVWEPRG